jgi:hypothetical protein
MTVFRLSAIGGTRRVADAGHVDSVQAQEASMRIFPDSVSQALFDRGGLKAVFDHARKLVVATIIVAAGFETVRRFDTIDSLACSIPCLRAMLLLEQDAHS